MANRWGNMETVRDIIFLGGGGSKITMDGDCSYEIKRYLLLGRKAMTNLDSVFKSRNITLLTKACTFKNMVFPVVVYWWENWIIRKTKHQRTDYFELWCWRRLLTVPWTAKRSSLSIRKDINPEYSLGGLSFGQYFGQLIQRVDSLKETLMVGKIEGSGERDDRGWAGWITSLTQWTWAWANSRR